MTKTFFSVALGLLMTLATADLWAQTPANHSCGQQKHQSGKTAGHHCGHCGHAQQSCAATADGIPMEIVRAFPTVKSVTKGEKWTEVYDVNKKLLGYAVWSKPASDGVKGYNGETPLFITLDADKNVRSVSLLPNGETPAYLQKVKKSGLLNSWNGLSLRKAKKKNVDAVSGATISSQSIIQTFQKAIENL